MPLWGRRCGEIVGCQDATMGRSVLSANPGNVPDELIANYD